MSLGHETSDQLPSSLATTASTTTTPTPTPTTTTLDPRLDFLAGTVAGVASLLTGQPFDTIKVRLQCQDRSHKTYRNAVHGFFKIVEEEKLKGLFKGVTSPMLGVAAINACVFSSYGLAQRHLAPLFDPSNPFSSNPSLLVIFLSGSASGLVTSIITTPIERLKILQQSARGRRQPRLIELVKKIGARGLYRGWTATCWRDLGYGPYFGVYEAVIRSRFGRDGPGRGGEGVEEDGREGPGTARVLIAGGLAGIAGWGSTFAMDVVKTRIQASEAYVDQARTIAHPYRTVSSTIRNSYRAEGVRVFFVGLGPTLLRSVPVNMVCFFVFEAIVSAFR